MPQISLEHVPVWSLTAPPTLKTGITFTYQNDTLIVDDKYKANGILISRGGRWGDMSNAEFFNEILPVEHYDAQERVQVTRRPDGHCNYACFNIVKFGFFLIDILYVMPSSCMLRSAREKKGQPAAVLPPPAPPMMMQDQMEDSSSENDASASAAGSPMESDAEEDEQEQQQEAASSTASSRETSPESPASASSSSSDSDADSSR